MPILKFKEPLLNAITTGFRAAYKRAVVFFVVVSAGIMAEKPSCASIYGPGGLLLNPTAEMPQKGELTPSALAIPQDAPGALGGNRTLASYGLTYGVTENIELGINHLRLNPTAGAKADPSNGASLKVRLLRGKVDGRPDVIIGGNFLSGGDLDGETGFIAARFATALNQSASKTANLHLGLMYANNLWGIQRRELVPYVGLDMELLKNLRAFAEVRQRMGVDGPIGGLNVPDVRAPHALGVVWQPKGSLKIFLGIANNGQSRSTRPSIGIGYTVGVRGSSRRTTEESPVGVGYTVGVRGSSR